MRTVNITALDVINYIGSRGKKFPHESLKKHKGNAVLAGGAVANAILSISEGKEYPLNDMDVFVLTNNDTGASPFGRHKGSKGKEQFKTAIIKTKGYPTIFNNILYIEDRVEEDEEVDHINMGSTQKIDPDKFPETVLHSFDLNCVQAGIYYNGTEYVLVTLYPFVEFVKSKQVEIVNVHSQVTFARAVKKAHDLNGYIDLDVEMNVVLSACNTKDLKPMTPDQEKKHSHYLSEVDVCLKKIYAREGMVFYQQFSGTKIQNIRPAKIKVLRGIYAKRQSKRVKNIIKQLLGLGDGINLIRMAVFYDGPIEEWISSAQLDDKRYIIMEEFLGQNPMMVPFFLYKTLPEILDSFGSLQKYEKEHNGMFLGTLETILSSEDKDIRAEYTDIEIINLTLNKITKDKETQSVPFFKESGQPLPTLEIDGVLIKELLTPYEVIVQGVIQKHCVGGYASQVQTGSCRIMSVYNREKNELSTMQLSVINLPERGKILLKNTQHLGKLNRQPNDTTKLAVRKYEETLNKELKLTDYVIRKGSTKFIEEEFIPF